MEINNFESVDPVNVYIITCHQTKTKKLKVSHIRSLLYHYTIIKSPPWTYVYVSSFPVATGWFSIKAFSHHFFVENLEYVKVKHTRDRLWEQVEGKSFQYRNTNSKIVCPCISEKNLNGILSCDVNQKAS